MVSSSTFRWPGLIFLLLVSGFCMAQKQAYIWHFGDGRSIDFSSGAPVVVPGSSMNSFEGSASYSDRCGNFLFYTNGGGSLPFVGVNGRIWNANNSIMYDMQFAEGGGYSAAQSSVIFEAPGQDSVYYLFTMEDQEDSASGNGLSYFTIDMRLNGGLGDVVQVNQQVFSNTIEGLCAIRHANKIDYWIIIYHQGSGLDVYSVTPSGVSFWAGFTGFLPMTIEAANNIKASPDGSRLIASFDDTISGGNQQYLFDFDNSTGQLSNPSLINPTFSNGSFISSEFSHNSRYLYTLQRDSITPYPNPMSIIQYDLLAPNINASAQSVANYSLYGYLIGIQLGPDGKIYFVDFYSDTLGNIGCNIGRINCPNTSSPTVQLGVVNFPNSIFQNLPNFPAWLFESDDDTYVNLGPDTVYICDFCDTLRLDALNPGATYAWSNGATSQSISVTAPGTYSVSVSGPCGSGTDQIVVLSCDTTSPSGCEIFQYTGAVQQWTVPPGIDTLFVKMWGAAGGGGPDATNNWGGGGGFAEAVIPVTPGQVMEIYVGGGGQAANNLSGGAGGWPNGGNGGSGNRIVQAPLDSVGGSGGGGGRSEIRIAGVSYVIAGGGGGGACNRPGGYGGGLEAEYTATSNSFNIHGFGGTQTAGGLPASNTICPHPVSGTAGATLQGGTGATDFGGTNNDRTGGGGGGDGYFGGGGGGSYDGCFVVGSAGGGGSGYVCSACPGVSGSTLTQQNFANFGLPANESDPLLSSYPQTGKGEANRNGGHGLVQICYRNICASYDTMLSISSCNSFPAPDGTVLTQNGVYTYYLLNSQGCDSIVSFDLTIENNATAQQDIFSCGPYTAPDGALFTQSTSFNRFFNAANGCDSIVTFNLTVSDGPPVDAGAESISIIEGDSVQLNASGAVSYVWSPAEGLSCTNCASPLAFPSTGATYTVTATDANGCTATDDIRIAVDIKCSDLFLPDIFSPNGKGPAVNNRLCVFGNCIRLFSLIIYNRWGEQVFETTDLNACWDGVYNGSAAQPGIYAYKLYAELSKGQVIDTKGTITLIR